MKYKAAGGHAPPSRAARAREMFLRVLASTIASIKGGDLNVDKKTALRFLGGKIVGHGVVWLRVSPIWKVVYFELVDLGGDHLAVFAKLRRRWGKHKGETVTVLVVNAMSVSARPKRAIDIFRSGLDLEPDLIIGNECGDFRAHEVDTHNLALPAQYEWFQPFDLQSMNCLGVRKMHGSLDKTKTRLGSRATSEGKDHPSANGHGINERRILIGRITTRS